MKAEYQRIRQVVEKNFMLRIETDCGMEDVSQLKTRVYAFVEMLN